ncbi:MAG: hypothetical protein GY789_27990 [Hyphomicrobiales bacterium]|nr:hypothetical protein [Hyphomicrobiales bacterium]MCP4999820.1 hypothetical protein [Hyphomicrobiales bacterium]
MTPKPDTEAIVRRRGHVLIKDPLMCQDNAKWHDSHAPVDPIAVLPRGKTPNPINSAA